MAHDLAPSHRNRLAPETIVEAAISRVEHYGLEQLSARKLAQDLGFEAMSLYHHIGSMDALKDAMVDRMLGSLPASAMADPLSGLREEALSYLAMAKDHPRSFPLVATRLWKGDPARMAATRAVQRFTALGASPDEALAKARALGAYLNGAGLALSAWATDPVADQDISRQVDYDLRRGLDCLLTGLASQT